MKFSDYCEVENIDLNESQAPVGPKYAPGVKSLDDTIWYIYFMQKESLGASSGVFSSVWFCKTGTEAQTKLQKLKDEVSNLVFVTLGICNKDERTTIKKKLDRMPAYKQLLSINEDINLDEASTPTLPKYAPGITPSKDTKRLFYIYYIRVDEEFDRKASFIQFYISPNELGRGLDTLINGSNNSDNISLLNIGICSKDDKNTIRLKLDKLPQYKQYLASGSSKEV